MTGAPHDPTSAPKPAPGLLSYRAVRYLSFVGMAPRWIDFLLILVTAVFLFFAMGGLAICAIAESVEGRLIAASVSAVGWIGTYGLYWWSNHFRHKKPVSIDDAPLASPAAPPSVPMAVIPVTSAAAPMPVIPVSEVDPALSRSAPDPAPPAPGDRAT